MRHHQVWDSVPWLQTVSFQRRNGVRSTGHINTHHAWFPLLIPYTHALSLPRADPRFTWSNGIRGALQNVTANQPSFWWNLQQTPWISMWLIKSQHTLLKHLVYKLTYKFHRLASEAVTQHHYAYQHVRSVVKLVYYLLVPAVGPLRWYMLLSCGSCWYPSIFWKAYSSRRLKICHDARDSHYTSWKHVHNTTGHNVDHCQKPIQICKFMDEACTLKCARYAVIHSMAYKWYNDSISVQEM